VKRFPHTITYELSPSGSQEVSGDWTQATAGNAIVVSCRVEFNAGGREIKLKDGSIERYSLRVFMPASAEIIPDGTTVTLSYDGQTYTGWVLGFVKDQKHCRLWV